MKAIIQRVHSASVCLQSSPTTTARPISQGLYILLGIHKEDTPKDLEYVVNKCLSLRLFPSFVEAPTQTAGDGVEKNDGEGTATPLRKQWKQSITDVKGDILVVSQFTLHAVTTKGAQPDFHLAMGGTEAKGIYDEFLKLLSDGYRRNFSKKFGNNEGGKIEKGYFGEYMRISLECDGPVSIVVDSRVK